MSQENKKIIIASLVFVSLLCNAIAVVWVHSGNIQTINEASTLEIVTSISSIATLTTASFSKQKNQLVPSKLLQHSNRSNNINEPVVSRMVDASIIQLILQVPSVKSLIFQILDADNNKSVEYSEMESIALEIYLNYSDKDFIKAFCKELFDKINQGQPFDSEVFSKFFDEFLLSLLQNSSAPFEHTPPFEKEQIKGLVKFLAKGRKNWDKCLITIFHILDADGSQEVTVQEIKSFFNKLNPSIWTSAQPFVYKIFNYMRFAGCASSDSFNLGGLITFGELVRRYIPKILDDYIK